MADIAQISSGTVINIIVADNVSGLDPAYTWVDLTGISPAPQIGWTYNGSTFAPPGLPNTAYGDSVTMTTDGVHDTYTVNGLVAYVFTAGTSQATVYLTIAIKTNLARAQDAIEAFTESRYSLGTQNALRNIYTLSAGDILHTNRAAYCKQLMTWGQSVIAYAATYITTVQALTDPATVAAMVPDFSSLVSSDPLITPVAALAISN